MTEQDFTNRIDGLINDYEGGESTSKELRDGILDTLIELVSKVSPFEAPVSPMLAEWISVKDRLPEDEDRVAVLYRYKDSLKLIKWIAEYDIENNKWKTYQFDDCKIEYWMPLPEPPKQ